jgi:ubiquitin-conjugating enzyme E2 Z
MEFIKKESIQRLAKDVKDIIKNPLDENNIFYKHDDENILKGYALIIGIENTPYYGGYYFFNFDFPNDYPYTPPKLTFLSNNDNIRYNPNLYRTGKVCLSILNTWRGESWTSCQTIRTILLTLCTILNDRPLLNEPGINEKNKDCSVYNEIIFYKNIENNILGIMQKKFNHINNHYALFEKYILKNFKDNFEKLKNIIKEKKHEKSKLLRTDMYNMAVNINYNNLYKNFIKNKIEK